MVLTGCKFYCRQTNNSRNKVLFNRSKPAMLQSCSDVNNCDVNIPSNSTVAIPIDETVPTVPHVSHLSSNGYYGFVACNVDTTRCDSETFGGSFVNVNKQNQPIETTTASDIMDVEQQSDLDERKFVGMTSLPSSSDQTVAAFLNGCIAQRKRIFSDDQIFDKTTSKRFRFDTDDQYFRTNGDNNQFSSMDHEDIPIPTEQNQSFHHSSAEYQSSNNVIDPVNPNKSMPNNKSFILKNNLKKIISIDHSNLEVSKLSSKLECYDDGLTNQHNDDRYSHELSSKTNYTNIDFVCMNEKIYNRSVYQDDDQLNDLFLSLHGGSHSHVLRHLSNFLYDEI